MFHPSQVNEKNVVEIIRWCILNDDMSTFYLSPAWRKKRKQILKKDKWECQQCKARGCYTKATTVHHEKHVRQFPDLALSETFVDDYNQVKRQLVSVCTDCHRKIHSKYIECNPKFTTEERWD